MEKLEESLKEMLIEKYGSLNAFCQKYSIPWGTLDSILKRGVTKANVLNVIKIAKALNIDTDALSEGEIRPARSSVSTLSPLALDVARAFDRADPVRQEVVCDTLHINPPKEKEGDGIA